jgi:hypothetical protein
MATAGVSAVSAWVSVITTGLNSLPYTGTNYADVEIDMNTYRSIGSGSGVWPWSMDVALILASLTPSSPTAIGVYSLPAIDDTPTNYADETEQLLVGSWLPSTAAAAKYLYYGGYPIWRDGRYLKLRVKNQLGVNLASSGNILKVRFRFDESA